MLENENTRSKFYQISDHGICEFQPNSSVEEVAIELIYLQSELAKKKNEVEVIENKIERKLEQLKEIVLKSKIETTVIEPVCEIFKS